MHVIDCLSCKVLDLFTRIAREKQHKSSTVITVRLTFTLTVYFTASKITYTFPFVREKKNTTDKSLNSS